MQENALLLPRKDRDPTYLDFVNACWNGFSGQVQNFLKYLAIIYQSFLAKNYTLETMYFVACFKQLWKKEFMQAWLDYCLINPSGRSERFYPDNQLREIIIKLCKEKVRSSSNAKSDKFLYELIASKIISL